MSALVLDKLLIAVDPGVVTGIAIWDTVKPPYAVELGEDDAMDLVEEHLSHRTGPSRRQTLVICEDFVPRGGALTWYPESLHQIGHLKHECRQRGISYRLQTATNAKKFATDAKLKKFRSGEWYRIGMAAYRPDITSHPQAIDAIRHLVLAATKTGFINAEEMLLCPV